MLILWAAVAVAALVAAALSYGRIARSAVWRATVTPLASIIGSGFLICGPLLASEFGGAAALAMAALLLLAYGLGAAVRFNIAHLEPLLAKVGFHDPIAWTARGAQAVLAAAYAVSVAYYLKLLAEFGLEPFPVSPALHLFISHWAVTALIAVFAIVGMSGGHRPMERLAHLSVSLKIGVIAGMLTALALYWLFRWTSPVVVPQARVTPASIGLVLGLLVTVQGFETSRYLGHAYSPKLRIRSMRYAQWLSSAIYIGFLLLLTPLLGVAAQVRDVAGILRVMEIAAPFMGLLVLVGAASSQLSAAVADSIGSAGLTSEASRGRIGVRAGFMASAALAVAVTWLTDPFQVVAVASRFFAVFYMMQCLLALMASRRQGVGGPAAVLGFASLGVLSLFAALAAAPAG
ncbi:MAG TPA: hypothetical protein VGS12_01735 [Caulobacteraceae bacterium]|nr:hypothetical protein [Caulobacteraceae bacterium]